VNKKIILIPIVAIIVIIFASFPSDDSNEQRNTIFHVILADPNKYTNGVYTEVFTLEKGEYFFKFVPNGSSPEILSITLNGETINFSENFQLVGTPHQTGISEYFTWEYNGQKNILIPEMQEISITINPNGETLGSVSVYILEN